MDFEKDVCVYVFVCVCVCVSVYVCVCVSVLCWLISVYVTNNQEEIVIS